jgi:hypothetical protein
MTIFIKINYNFIFKLKKLKIIFLQKGCRQPRSHGLPDHPSPVKDANIMDMTMCKTMVKESCKETNKSSTSFLVGQHSEMSNIMDIKENVSHVTICFLNIIVLNFFFFFLLSIWASSIFAQLTNALRYIISSYKMC